jgi:SAM-dependent methyltransferase
VSTELHADAGERCPACDAAGLLVFHEQEGIPTNSCLLLDSVDDAVGYPIGDLRLGFCPECGFITNTRFDPRRSEYSARYEETQAFSAHFVAFAKDLAERWVKQYDLEGRSVLEIGCGKGEFLTWMCEAGAGTGIGIDPGAHPERLDSPAADRITWITDFYSEAYTHLAADAIVCRHTLEHIHPVGDFMRMIRRSIGDRLDTIVLFELPDVARVLEEIAFWDVYYEHCSYFSAGSLARLFRATGFDVLDVRLDYDDQYLLVEARPTPGGGVSDSLSLPIERDLGALARCVADYSSGYDALLGSWSARLEALRSSGGSAVVWGAGSKGVSFLTNLASSGGDPGLVSAAVDINPYKWGKFMAGTGHEIVSPASLVADPPDLVIAMNAVYLGEIKASLDALGIRAELVAV